MTHPMSAPRHFDVSGLPEVVQSHLGELHPPAARLPQKEMKRGATHWLDCPHSKLHKFHKNGPIFSKSPHGSRR